MVPLVAGILAAAYLLIGLYLPILLSAVAIMTIASTCYIVLLRRPSPGLRWTLIGVSIWLVVAIGGAGVLDDEPVGGLLWILLALFLVPLVAIPVAYWFSFDKESE